jgi:glycosyltransferase involved in cell wall biosynthesis
MLSICITCKNRSLVDINGHKLKLFPRCIDSILAISDEINEELELVVSDWGSDDWPLEEWLPQKIDGRIPLTIVPIEKEGFSRGVGLNTSFYQAEGDKIFFLDTDMLFESSYVFNIGLEVLEKGMASFPICFSYKDNKHEEGWWRATGYGNVMVNRDDFMAVGHWWEKDTWGKEDDNLVYKLSRMVKIWRENTPGFFHQWHPNDLAWKGRYQV